MRLVSLGNKVTKHLIARGLPRDVLRARPFDTKYHTVSIVSQVDGMKTRKVAKALQLTNLEATLTKPFGQPYIYVISGTPNDGKAKQVAAFIMECATLGQMGGKFPRSTRGQETPLWHTVTGSFYDRLRDGAKDHPSMLILSNITGISSNVKIEKVRDLLEMYNSIPRIVVLSGEDPVTFANSKLFMPVNKVLLLATARKVEL